MATSIAIQLQHGLYIEVRVNGMSSGEIAVARIESTGNVIDVGPITSADPVFRYTMSRPLVGAAGAIAVWTQTGPAPWDWSRPYGIMYLARPTTTPAVDSVTPTQGPAAGGTIVRLDDNSPSTRPGIYDRVDAGVRSWVRGVRFGTSGGTNLRIINAKRLEVTTPPGTAGSNQPITLEYNIGTQVVTGIATGQTFTYQAAAPFAATVEGTGLQATVSVTQGLSGTAQARIYFRDPANVNAYVTVTGNGPQATHTYSQPGEYTIDVVRVSDNVTTSVFFHTPPVADWVFPGGGSPRGGETVTIYGQLLSIVTGVLFGGRLATGLNLISNNELEVVTPAGQGLLPIRLMTDYGEIQTGILFFYQDLNVDVSGRGLEVSVGVDGIQDTTATVRFAGGQNVIVTPGSPIATFTYPTPQQDQIVVTRAFDLYSRTVAWATLPYVDSMTPTEGRVGTLVRLEGGLFEVVEEVWFDGKQVEWTRISDSVIEAVADG